MRNRSIAGPLSFALLAFGAWALAWPWYGGSQPLLEYSSSALVGLGGTEARVDLASLVAYFAIAGGLWVAFVRRGAPATQDSADPPDLRWRVRLRELAGSSSSFVAIALVAVVIACAVHLLLVKGQPLTEDEKTYLFQAALVRAGRLTTSAPPGATGSSFLQPFLVTAPASGHWSGQYFWAHPALLALGAMIGSPWVVSAVALFVAVIATGHLYKETLEAPDLRGAILAAALVATSPLVFFTAGTLHSGTVALACGTTGMWGLARLARGPSLGAAIALGLSTALASHVRPLDQIALLVGLTIAIVLREARRDDIDRPSALRALGGLLRRLGLPIAIALPFVLLHPLLNRAVSGDWHHSGYWLFNEGHGWKTFGFGRGPFGDRHSPDVAAAKTFAVLVRGLFSFVGGPLPFALLLLAPFLPASSRQPRALGMGAVVAVFGAVYFFYSAAPIHQTGPVYYEPLVPVLAVALAQLALRTYDLLKVRATGFEVAVPAAFLANLVASAAVFVPPVAREIASVSDHAHQCEALAADVAHDGPALIFVAPAGTAQTGWALWPPVASPSFDDAALFPMSHGHDGDLDVRAAFGAGRHTYLARCLRTDDPAIWRYDPETGATRSTTEPP